MRPVIARWEPLSAWLKGDLAVDDDLTFVINETRRGEHTERPGVFRALADQRSGFLGPRYSVVDFPGEFWERVAALLPSDG